jgi:hypothetical protein
MKGKRTRSAWQRFPLGLPYAWLLAFFLVPFLIVLKISLSQTAVAQPPYTPVLDLFAGWPGLGESQRLQRPESRGCTSISLPFILDYRAGHNRSLITRPEIPAFRH